jgi:uncharacterized protein (TIGR03067 family)
MTRLFRLAIRTLTAIVLVASTAASGAEPAAPATGDAAERAKLVGTWRGYVVDGTGEKSDRGPVKLVLTIDRTTIRGIELKGTDTIDHGTGDFTLDLAADPRQMDGTQMGERGRARTYLGIYMLEGQTLRWCVSPQKTRPTTFETKKGQFLLILQRDKAAAAGG